MMEDKILTEYIRVHGEGQWRNLPKRAGLKRCGKSCRLRWLNYLRPDIKRGNISPDEEELIIRLHKLLGNRWSLIAGRLPGRTDNEIKNYWNTNLGKKVEDRKSPVSKWNSRKKETRSPPPTTAVSESQLKKMTSSVVRTKAVRCSKVIIAPLPPPAPLKVEPINSKSNDVRGTAAGSSVGELVGPTTNVDGLSSFAAGDDDISADFTLDFSVGEFCLSDLLNGDFSDLFGLGCCNDKSNDDLSPLSDQNVSFSDEMLPNWADGDGCHTNVVSNLNLHSLSPFLEYGGEGLENS